jgi:transposase
MASTFPRPSDSPAIAAPNHKFSLAQGTQTEKFQHTIDELRAEVAALQAKLEKSPKDGARQKSERKKRLPKPAAEKGLKAQHKHGRAKLPEHLERRDTILELTPEEQLCPCCGKPRTCIGQTATEQLDREPVKYFVLRTIRKTYACKNCSTEVPPEQRIQTAKPSTVGPIEKGLCGPGLLADVIVSKFLDHLPLHRQVGILARSGVTVAESTLCDWIAQSATLLSPLSELMHKCVLSCPVAWSDDTRSRFAQPGEHVMPKGYFWVTIGDSTAPYTIFHFTTTHAAAVGPEQFLAGFQGYLHADCLAQYNKLFAAKVQHVACWAHARSKFFHAGDVGKVPFEFIQDLYRLERNLPPPDTPEHLAARKATRQEKAIPILNNLHVWLEATREKLVPKDLLCVAINYVLNHWEAFVRYSEDGRLSIDNNLSERTLRLIAVGRSNWKFVGNAKAGQRSAVLYTITGTCRHLGIDALAYLRDVLAAMHALGEKPSAEQLRPLLPDAWARRQQAVQKAA